MLSSTVTGRDLVSVEYSPPVEEWVRVSVWSAVSSSWPAVTVTIWGVFQLEDVNVRTTPLSDGPLRLRSVPAWAVMVTVTVTVGSVARLTP